jgi:hypothetical protein
MNSVRCLKALQQTASVSSKPCARHICSTSFRRAVVNEGHSLTQTNREDNTRSTLIDWRRNHPAKVLEDGTSEQRGGWWVKTSYQTDSRWIPGDIGQEKLKDTRRR